MAEKADKLAPPSGPGPRRRRARRGRYVGAAGLSLATHVGLVVAVVLLGTASPSPPPSAPPVTVDIMTLPRPAPPLPPSPQPAKPSPPKPPPPARLFRPTLARTPPDPFPAKRKAAPDPMPGLSDAELAGATTAGSGGGGGGGGACDMARRVQEALRRDPLVQSAVAPLNGKALMIWDGDWVWLPGEDGRGLTAVRQAVMWEVAFAPSECRGQTMHGLVVLSPLGSAGSTRLALGQGVWRWSDLLTPHPGSGSSRTP